MKNDPHMMRETERYLFLKGRYLNPPSWANRRS